ncbi:hypothetical protein [Arundinibacter roseus]|uniref:SCO family protein n=1 Tax=Arundinibacter roseus TaxID=2070510 RepID=A0A4R4K8D6_9BACT|nr:hypothetical protein [Arundinibacter roseus]TDB63663.1 hypothetical protein EZE20_15300 [Arundinibacter roseus]
MRTYIKTGLLVLTLAVPVLIFLFLKGFTTNHFDLPYFIPLKDSVTQQVTISEGDTVFYTLRDFSVKSIQSADTLSTNNLVDRTVIVSILPDSCRNGSVSCKVVLDQLARLSALLPDYSSLVMLTLVDAEVDLGNVLSLRKDNEKNWRILSVQDSSLTYLQEKVFYLSGKGISGQTISSSFQFSLIDSKGYIRGYYDPLDPKEMDRLFAEIKVLEYSRKIEK